MSSPPAPCATSRLRLLASREITGSRFGRPGRSGSTRAFRPAPKDDLVASLPFVGAILLPGLCCFSQGSPFGEREECWPTGRQFSVSLSRSAVLVFTGDFGFSSATVFSEGRNDTWLSSWRDAFPITVVNGSLLKSPRISAALFEASLLRRTVSRDVSQGCSEGRGDTEPG